MPRLTFASHNRHFYFHRPENLLQSVSTHVPAMTVEESITEHADVGNNAASPEPAAKSAAVEAPLLMKDTITPPRWPAHPKPIVRSLGTRIAQIVVDVLLVAGSCSFFAFALAARCYDGASTLDNPRASNALFETSTYVRNNLANL